MSLRKQSRQLVVQMLYQIDLNPDITAGEVRRMIEEHGQNTTSRNFAWQLFSGIMEYKSQIDEEIKRVAENWSLNRMAVTDRNILRLGAYELCHTDTPSAVVIDEAVELAREFGSAQSSQFVNGILDKLIPGEDNAATAKLHEDDSTTTKEDLLAPSSEKQPQSEPSTQDKMLPKPSTTPPPKLDNPWAR